jgi:hypothetical protein
MNSQLNGMGRRAFGKIREFVQTLAHCLEEVRWPAYEGKRDSLTTAIIWVEILVNKSG